MIGENAIIRDGKTMAQSNEAIEITGRNNPVVPVCDHLYLARHKESVD